MAANKRRGEIAAVLDGQERILCLTLGALAELENAFSASDLTGLAERFAIGRFSANDLTSIVGAALRGGGSDVQDKDVMTMRADGGVAGFAAIVAELLAVTFGNAGDEAGASHP